MARRYGNLMDHERNISARDAILGSIREHLAASAPHDAVHAEGVHEAGGGEFKAATLDGKVPQPNGSALSLVEIFSENLKAVGGREASMVVGAPAGTYRDC